MAKAKATWAPLDLATLPNCRYIACDPSLAASGLVLFEVHDAEVYILGAERVGTERTDKLGWEDTFLRTSILKTKLRDLLAGWIHDYGNTFIQGVHEAPPVGGGMMRTESTILSGYAFRQVCEELTVSVDSLVTAHSHKALLCGNGRASKKEHGDAIKALLPDVLDGKQITNEALRDAFSVGLYAAHRKKKEREQW